MKKLTVVLVAFMTLLVCYSSPAYADSPSSDDDNNLNARLHGEYAYVMTRICSTGRVTEWDPLLFAPAPDLTLLRPAGSETRVLQGILRYNGDGTGTSEGGHHLGVRPTDTWPGSNPIRQNEFSCAFTYSVNSDDTFTQWMECSSTRIAGPVVDDFFEVTGVVVQGQIIKTGKTLVLSDTNINVENLTRYRDSQIHDFQRICGRSGTAVEVRKGRKNARDD